MHFEIVGRGTHQVQHRSGEVVSQAHYSLYLVFDDMHHEVIFDEQSLLFAQVSCLLIIFQVSTDLVGEGRVLFHLRQYIQPVRVLHLFF